MLERCDKIWETLQLIKIVQKPTEESTNCEEALTDDCNKNEEKVKEETQNSSQIKRSAFGKARFKLKSEAMALFKFSVQRTRKLYPCSTCGKQYLERRSLRKHSERVHGVILPLLIERKRKRALKKKHFIEANPDASANNKMDKSEKFYDKDSCEETTAKKKIIETIPPPLTQVKCTLCQQKVTSLRKHLINYHKIGGSSSVMEQLESSLLNETTSSLPRDERTTLTDKPHKDGDRIMDNENDIRGIPQVKRKYTSSYKNTRKKFKWSNERSACLQNPPVVAQRQMFLTRSYKCDVCLGMYSSSHSLYKHKRNHTLRGETRENFHNFKCRYFNSPFNQKYKLSMCSAKSYKTMAEIPDKRENENDKLKLNNSKHNTSLNPSSRATRYSERISKNNETVCICGRSFRNPHTLFIHKKNCEVCQIEDNTTQSSRVSSDRDSGIGINITIKKRNDSYEIVGKDDEDKLGKFETHLKEDTLPLSHTSKYTKDLTKASPKQQVLETSESSKYSKNHSILKLEDIDEDVIIDIEDDLLMESNILHENNTTKQMIKDNKWDLSKQQNKLKKDGKTEKVFDKVSTLKQMCQEVLDVLEMQKSGNIKNKEYRQIKDQEICKENRQIKNQEIHQENKRELRSTNKRNRYSEAELLDHSLNNEIKVCTMQHDEFDPLMCGYCKEQFKTTKLYDNHQCSVKEGKSFDEFSLRLLCFYCKEILNSYSEFDDHMRMRHFEHSLHCYQCPERFTSDKVRLNHYHSEHNDLICRFCGKKISISSRIYHEGYHLGFGYPCHKCKKAYLHNKNLFYHKYTIHAKGADNLMTCSICLKLVKLKTFRGHMSTHKHNACYFCGKIFTDRVGLEYHTMLHHGTNSKLKCNHCGTRFYTKKQLEKHEKVDGCNNGVQGMKKKTV